MRTLRIPRLLKLFGLLAVGALLLALTANYFLESQGVRAHASARTGKELGGSAGFLPLSWRGPSVRSAGLLVQGSPEHALTQVRARDISAQCSLIELWRKKWRIDDLRVGEIEAAFGEGASSRLAIELPSQPELYPPTTEEASLVVEIRRVVLAEASIFWGEAKPAIGGLRKVTATCTLDGRNLAIEAHDGSFQQSGWPEAKIRSAKLYYSKPQLRIDEGTLLLGNKGLVGVKGQLIFGEQPAMDLHVTFQDCPVAPFLSDKSRSRFDGSFSGVSEVQKQLTSAAELRAAGYLVFAGASLQKLDVLDRIAEFTGRPAFAQLKLQKLSAHYLWQNSKLAVDDFELEARGLVRVEGRFTVRDKVINGTFQIGTTAAILEKFPGAREQVFTRQRDGYFWTAVKISGPLDHPQDDLKPRLVAAAQAQLAKKLLAPLLKPGETVIQSIEALF